MKNTETDNSNRVVSRFEVGESYATRSTIIVNGVSKPKHIMIIQRTPKMLWIQGTEKSDLEVGEPTVHIKKIKYLKTTEESEAGLLITSLSKVSQHEVIDAPKLPWQMNGGKAWADSRRRTTPENLVHLLA
jgi:hypothetical protein